MSENFEKLAAIANKVKTPLALAGLTITVLYGIYRQVLSLDIFTKVGEESTVILIGGILDKLFWLALIALIMGGASYALGFVMKVKTQRQANIEMIDAHITSDSKIGDKGVSDDRDK